jgi:type IV pilus assembly protein PilC
MLAVGVLMMIYVVPGLAAGFKEAGAELPPLTRIVVAISEFLQNDILLALLGAGVLGGVAWRIGRTPIGARSIAWVVIRLPIFGKLVKEFNSALATRTLSSLISAGVDIVHAIEITKDVLGNVFYKETLEQAKVNVQKGVPLSQVFVEHSEIYPVMVGDMMEVGEETGQLSNMLLKIATFYEEEVSQATEDMSKLVEPILMAIIAVFVGIFAVAMITPMYSLMEHI